MAMVRKNQIQINKKKQEYRNMNLNGIDLPQFLVKFKGLIKKISKTHPSEINDHSQKCHSIIAELINDQNTLPNLNSQQLRLLAYESVLFLVEFIKTKSENETSKDLRTNKIERFLSQIYQTLASIKHLINDMQSRMTANNTIKNSMNSKPINANQFDKLHNNLHIYQQKIGKIVSQFESQNHIKPNQTLKNYTQLNEENDLLIEQMHRIIQKKQDKILQLTKLLQKNQQEQLNLQKTLQEKLNFHKTYNQTLTQHQLNNSALLKQIQELKLEKKEFLKIQEQQKIKFLMEQKQKIRNGLSIYETTNEKIITNLTSYQHILFKSPIQTITQSTIPSAKYVQKTHVSPRKFSLDKVGSNKSFRRIFSGDERDSISVDKKYSDLHQKNQQFYRLLLCQASTIEELI